MLLTPIPNTTHIYTPPVQSIANSAGTVETQNEWEISETLSETEKFVSHAVVSAAEQFIAKFDQTDFTKIATQFGAAMYQKLNRTLENMTQSTLGVSNTTNSNHSNHSNNADGKFGAKELQTFRDSIDDLDGLW